ncbi:putative late blight resistance protein R1A-3 [Capsicum chacoense]
MAQNYIDDMLNHLRRIESGGDSNNFKIDQIEALKMELRFLRTFSKYNHVLLPNSLVIISKKGKSIVEMLHIVFGEIPDECEASLILERLESQLLEFTEGSASLRYNYELNVSYLSEYMDCLDENLNDVLTYLEWGTRSQPSLTNEEILQTKRFTKQLKIVQKKMRFLRYLYLTKINGYVDHDKLQGLETRIQFMADNVGQLCFVFWIYGDEDETDSEEDDDDTDEDGDDIESKLPYILFLVVIVKLEMQKIFLSELTASKFSQSRIFKDKKLSKGFSYYLRKMLLYLRNEKLKNFTANVTARNIDVAIEFLLVFLSDVPNDVINGKRLNEVLANIGGLVGDILCVIQMLLAGSIIKEDASKIDIRTIQILEKIEDLKSQVETYYKSLKFTASHEFPTVGGLSFLDSLLGKLNEMLKSETSLNLMMKPHICILEKEISSLIYAFKDASKVQHEREILKDLQKRTINLAYEAEVAIDFILVRYNVLWHSFWSLPAIIKEIDHINVEVREMRSANLSSRPCFTVKHVATQHSNLMTAEEIVGFRNDTEKMIQYLTRGTNELDVVPIVGMGGQGKTTIARKVYNHDIVISHFDVRAWCIISQTYNRRELLQDIFNQVTNSNDKGDKDDVLADILKKNLTWKRYLIVLDDMWDGAAWDDFCLCFPDVGNRSRIVVTTRLEKVGEHVKRYTDLYFLPFLTPDESCKLLQKKVFQEEDFPLELQDVSLAVAKRCRGLPLVVVLIAGIIKKRPMEESWWHEVKNALFSYLGESEEYSLSTMQLSYDNLPDHLRPCLLYIGMFPEDARIPVSKLISLWIAEGFMQNVESGRLMEEAAEGYLMDLISSNVVMVSKREYNGKVKYCHVHDVVLHFCMERSREEKFMLAVKGHRSQLQPSGCKENRVRFSFSTEHSNFTSQGSKIRTPSHQHVRSLITTNQSCEICFDLFDQISEFRLLKVLDLSSHGDGVLRSATLKPLIHLKYLAVSVYQFVFHPELHLSHLETLIVKGIDCSVLPASFWKMEKLRHVEIRKAEFDLENNLQQIFEESSKLENLRILRRVVIKIGDADSVDMLLWMCPNLRELDIHADSVKADSAEIFPTLERLTQLQVLRLSIESSIVVSKLHLPSNLRKLVLSRYTRGIGSCGSESVISESMISVIAGLPSLECLSLKLEDLVYESEEWCLRDITFHKLKFLKLDGLNISRWDVSEESFPMLETLVIKDCDDLEEIPLSFADIQTLKQIKLIDCHESLEASTVRIKEEVESIEGCDRINLILFKFKLNFRYGKREEASDTASE